MFSEESLASIVKVQISEVSLAFYIIGLTGMHCVHSWFNSRGINGTARASIYFYNNEQDITAFTDAIKDTLSG